MRIGRFGSLAAPLLLMQLHLRLGVAAAATQSLSITSLRCGVRCSLSAAQTISTRRQPTLSFCLQQRFNPKSFGSLLAQGMWTISRPQARAYRDRVLGFLISALGAPVQAERQ